MALDHKRIKNFRKLIFFKSIFSESFHTWSPEISYTGQPREPGFRQKSFKPIKLQNLIGNLVIFLTQYFCYQR